MNSFWRQLKKILVIFCCLFTVIVGGFMLINGQNVVKMARVIGLIENHFLWESNMSGMFEGAIAGVVNSLGDKYSVYYNREETKEHFQDVQGVFGGIGVFLTEDEGRTVVSSPVEGSVSDQAGIQSGDVIMNVNGEDVSMMDTDQVVARLRGDIGTEVQVSVLREADQKIYDYTLIREEINDTSAAATLLSSDPDIAYLRITKFASNTDEEVVDALNELIHDRGFKGLIVDLRNNGGGDVNAATNIAGLFVPAGPIVHIVDKDGSTNTVTSSGAKLEVPLVVLVNEYSASASEIFAGAIKDTHAGTLVGTKTFGKGIVQVVYPLKDGSSVKLTQSRYLTPNKNDINQVGIEPDVYCDFPEDMTLETFQDVQLEKAIEILQEKM